MKAVILARVSTEEQREAGNSLPAQQIRLHAYIQRMPKLALDREYIFDETAFKEHRKEFQKVIDYLVAQKEIIALCCDKVDRLSRDFLVGLPVLEKLRREGKIELHFPSDNLILHQNSPATDLFHFNIAVSLAQYYSNAISDNVKRAFEQKRRKGEWIGKPRIGYKNDIDINDNKTIVADPQRAHLIVKLFELYATGNYSYQTARADIIKQGLRTKDGKPPSKSIIENILKDTFYYGIAVSKKYGAYAHSYERLISKELFDRCQEVRLKRKKSPNKEVSKDFIFKGLLKCENCGCAMSPETKTKKSRLNFTYYSCTNSKGICKRVYVPEKALLKPIYDVLSRLESISEATQEKVVNALRKTTESEVAFHQAQVSRIRTEQDTYNERKDGLLDLFLDKSITKPQYDKKMQEYTDKLQTLNIEFQEHTNADCEYQTTVATVFSLARRAKSIFDSSEKHEKRAFIGYLVQNPTVKEKTLVFTMRSPFNVILELADQPVGLGR